LFDTLDYYLTLLLHGCSLFGKGEPAARSFADCSFALLLVCSFARLLFCSFAHCNALFKTLDTFASLFIKGEPACCLVPPHLLICWFAHCIALFETLDTFASLFGKGEPDAWCHLICWIRAELEQSKNTLQSIHTSARRYIFFLQFLLHGCSLFGKAEPAAAWCHLICCNIPAAAIGKSVKQSSKNYSSCNNCLTFLLLCLARASVPAARCHLICWVKPEQEQSKNTVQSVLRSTLQCIVWNSWHFCFIVALCLARASQLAARCHLIYWVRAEQKHTYICKTL